MRGIEISIANSSVGAVHVLHPKLNPPLPSRDWLESGSKAGIKRKRPVYALSLVPLLPCRGQGERQGATQLFPIRPQGMGREEDRADKMVLVVI
jgi:hypothetical protein